MAAGLGFESQMKAVILKCWCAGWTLLIWFVLLIATGWLHLSKVKENLTLQAFVSRCELSFLSSSEPTVRGRRNAALAHMQSGDQLCYRGNRHPAPLSSPHTTNIGVLYAAIRLFQKYCLFFLLLLFYALKGECVWHGWGIIHIFPPPSFSEA